MEKSILDEENSVVDRIARRTLAGRGAGYSDEVRRLLDAGREVMGRTGTRARPRVADIVAAAGLSNDAFYRHFRSKDELVAAILEDGSERLAGYLAHQMAKAGSPEEEVRRWVGGVLAQAAPDVAATTLAVLWNAGTVAGPGSAAARLAQLLHPPLRALGREPVRLPASLLAHAVVGRLADHLWAGTQATAGEVDRIVAFCLGRVEPNGAGMSTVVAHGGESG